MDQKQFLSAMAQIAEEKSISQEQIIETIEMAIAAAYKRDYGKKGQNIKVKFDPKTGEIQVFQIFLVVDESMLREEDEEIKEEEEKEEEEGKKIKFNPYKHMMIKEARKIKKDVKPGDEVQVKLEAHAEYGRIAAQTAKQVIVQRLREAEREMIFDEYKDKEGEVVSAIVQRIEGRNIFLDIGKTTGILFPEEQIPGEKFFIGQRLRVYILKVEKSPKGANIVLSRAYPKLVSRLFAIEVPEISAGTVLIKSIAREPGSRTKIAVYSEEEGVDPVGSCVGQKGSRVQTVINELGGEKIDIIEWSEDMAKYIANSLSPAKILDVEIDNKKRTALAIAPEDQLSLAIGQRGQNVRLAAKLTGWKIDVKSDKMIKEEKKTKKKITKKDEKEKKLRKVRAIIYDIKNSQPYFLILHRILRWQGWEFVKETMELGENIKETLKRGIKEETGLKNFKIIKSLNKQEKWQALENDYFVVDTILVKADMNKKISLKQKIIEHDDYQWTDKETAIEKLTWPESKKLLKELEINETN